MKPFKIYENFRKMTRKNTSNIYEVADITRFPACVDAHVLISQKVSRFTSLCCVVIGVRFDIKSEKQKVAEGNPPLLHEH